MFLFYFFVYGSLVLFFAKKIIVLKVLYFTLKMLKVWQNVWQNNLNMLKIWQNQAFYGIFPNFAMAIWHLNFLNYDPLYLPCHVPTYCYSLDVSLSHTEIQS
jgi:hypothetical protein